MKKPEDYKPVLAKISGQTSLGKSTWHEAVYFDEARTNGWVSYAGSKTFDDGEKVIAWAYVDKIPLNNSDFGDSTVVFGDSVEVRNYTADLDGYIKNIEDIMNQAKGGGDIGFTSMIEFSVKLAKKFKELGGVK